MRYDTWDKLRWDLHKTICFYTSWGPDVRLPGACNRIWVDKPPNDMVFHPPLSSLSSRTVPYNYFVRERQASRAVELAATGLWVARPASRPREYCLGKSGTNAFITRLEPGHGLLKHPLFRHAENASVVTGRRNCILLIPFFVRTWCS